MITALRILLLLLSMLGFLALLAEKFGVRIEFAPAVVCAGFSSVLLLAGYFNLLPFAAGALWLTSPFREESVFSPAQKLCCCPGLGGCSGVVRPADEKRPLCGIR